MKPPQKSAERTPIDNFDFSNITKLGTIITLENSKWFYFFNDGKLKHKPHQTPIRANRVRVER